MRLTRRIVFGLALAGLLPLTTACRPQRPAFEDNFFESQRGLVSAAGQESEFIFVGTVAGTGQPPPAWSGHARARQAVAFQVERVLKGFAPEPTVTVYEPVVSGSRLAAGATAPGLSPTLFANGNRLIVFARRGSPPETFDGVDENVGVIPSSQRNDAAVEFILGLAP